MNPNASLIPATIALLRRHAPFDRMPAGDLDRLAARLSLTYHSASSPILEPGTAVPGGLYVIKQGAVAIEQPGRAAAPIALHEGECFPIGALVARRPVTGTYRASRDTFCFVLPEADFQDLLRTSATFHDFCTRRIAHMLEHSAAALRAEASLDADPRQPLDRRLDQVVQRPPVSCLRATPIREVLERMRRDGIGSMLVTNADGTLAGIFTLKDLLSRVALPGVDLGEPIERVMTPDPIRLPRTALAYEAALEMAQHDIHHIVVSDDERIDGLVSERDLFALQRIGLRQIGSAIQRASSVQALVPLAEGIREMTQGLIAQGVGAANLVRIVASLHDRLSRRVIALQLAGEPAAPGEFCWISLGSEGRQDRTLASDQDNGIIFPEGADAIATRERLLPVAGRINRALAQVGFPECPGFIMASNPKWCLSLSEWRAEFSHWISVGDPEAVLKANIFFDFRPLYGDAAPAQALREWLVEAVKGNSRFLRLMAENALANTPPLGLLRDFEVAGDDSAHPGTIDLKMRGATVFTDCARIYALAHGVEVTNTSRRLLEVSDRGAFPRADAEAWVAAIDFLQHFRLRHQHARLARGEKPDNYLRPEHLNDLDRRLLKECLRSARRLQQRVALDYGL